MNHDKTDTTILLDIYERLGAIEERMKHIEKLEAEVEVLKDFKSKAAAYIWLGGSIASGVLFFLWQGIKYGMDQWLHR
jgi:hypothetical protein